MTDQPTEDGAGDTALEQRSRELFNERVDSLDARTRSRLNRARQAALAAAKGESRSVSRGVFGGSRWLLPVGSAAALALVTVSAVQLLRTQSDIAPPGVSLAASGTVDDLEILASNEEIEMLQDIEFYAWLDTQSDSLGADPSISEAG